MEQALTMALWWAPLLALAFAFRLAGLCGLRPFWLAAALALNGVYMLAIVSGGELIPLEARFGPLDWNWAGKIAAIASTLGLFAVLALTTKAISPESTGFTLRQRQGSVTPALIVLAIMTASMIGLELLAADGRSMDPERLAYQATMPGLDEELFFRGLLLAALGAALPTGGVNLLGARITVAGLLVTLLFGLAHGLSLQDGKPVLSWIYIVITGYLGFGLLWMRERTGSVLLPIIGHNVINFSGSFF